MTAADLSPDALLMLVGGPAFADDVTTSEVSRLCFLVHMPKGVQEHCRSLSTLVAWLKTNDMLNVLALHNLFTDIGRADLALKLDKHVNGTLHVGSKRQEAEQRRLAEEQQAEKERTQARLAWIKWRGKLAHAIPLATATYLADIYIPSTFGSPFTDVDQVERMLNVMLNEGKAGLDMNKPSSFAELFGALDQILCMARHAPYLELRAEWAQACLGKPLPALPCPPPPSPGSFDTIPWADDEETVTIPAHDERLVDNKVDRKMYDLETHKLNELGKGLSALHAANWTHVLRNLQFVSSGINVGKAYMDKLFAADARFQGCDFVRLAKERGVSQLHFAAALYVLNRGDLMELFPDFSRAQEWRRTIGRMRGGGTLAPGPVRDTRDWDQMIAPNFNFAFPQPVFPTQAPQGTQRNDPPLLSDLSPATLNSIGSMLGPGINPCVDWRHIADELAGYGFALAPGCRHEIATIVAHQQGPQFMHVISRTWLQVSAFVLALKRRKRWDIIHKYLPQYESDAAAVESAEDPMSAQFGRAMHRLSSCLHHDDVVTIARACAWSSERMAPLRTNNMSPLDFFHELARDGTISEQDMSRVAHVLDDVVHLKAVWWKNLRGELENAGIRTIRPLVSDQRTAEYRRVQPVKTVDAREQEEAVMLVDMHVTLQRQQKDLDEKKRQLDKEVEDKVAKELAARGMETSVPVAPAAQEKVCVVCLDGPQDWTVIRCGHKSLCEHCVPCIKQRGTCPVCRQPIEDIIRTYDV